MQFVKSLKRISYFLVFFLVISLIPTGNPIGPSGNQIQLPFGPEYVYANDTVPASDAEDAGIFDLMRAHSLYSTGRPTSTFYNQYFELAFFSSLTFEEQSYLQFIMPESGRLTIEIYDSADIGVSAPYPNWWIKPLEESELDPLPGASFIPDWAAIEAADPLGYLYGSLFGSTIGKDDVGSCDDLVWIFKDFDGEPRAFDGEDDWGIPDEVVGSGGDLYNFIKWGGKYVPYDEAAYDPFAEPESLQPGKYLLVFNYQEDDPAYLTDGGNARYLPLCFAAGSPEDQMKMLRELEQYVRWKFPGCGWLHLRNPFYGDPVSLLTGTLSYEYTDLLLEGKNDLDLTRVYSHAATSNNFGFGYGWTHPFNYRVKQVFGDAYVFLPTGGIIKYEYIGGAWVTAPGNTWSLYKEGGSFKLSSSMGDFVEFDSDGYAMKIQDNTGYVIDLTNENGKLQLAKSRTGWFKFDWEGDFIKEVTDSQGRSVKYAYDGAGQLIEVQNPDKDFLSYDYDPNGKGYLMKISDFKGVVYLENFYDDIGRVITQYQIGRGVTEYWYNDDDRKNGYKDASGKEVEVMYDENDRIVWEKDNDGVREYHYDDFNRMDWEKDRRDNYTYYSYYDETVRIKGVKYPDGSTEKFEYDEKGRVTYHKQQDDTELRYSYDPATGDLLSETDGNKNIRSYTYENGYLKTSTDALGKTTIYDTDSMGNITMRKSPLGDEYVWTYDYDSAGRLTSQTSPLGNTYNYGYSDAGKLEWEQDPYLNERKLSYSKNGYVTDEQDWRGSWTNYYYDENNQPLWMSDREDEKTEYGYDIAGNLNYTKDPDGHEQSFTYSPMGHLRFLTDGRDNTFEFIYDRNGNMTDIIKPLVSDRTGQKIREEMTYDSMDRLRVQKNGRGNKTEYTYDEMGRLLSEKDDEGNKTVYRYDDNGNMILKIDANYGETEYIYDEENRLRFTISPEKNKYEYVYDDEGQLINVIDARGGDTEAWRDLDGNPKGESTPLGFVTEYTYDKLGRLTETKHPDGGKVILDYDKNGNLKYQEDAEHGITEFGYDKMDRLIWVKDAEGGLTEMNYTPGGNLDFIRKPEGAVTNYYYDENDNLIEENDGRGNSYFYNYDELNRLSSTEDREGYFTYFGYDDADNLTEILRPDDGIISYTYDKAERNTSITDGEDNRTEYVYDGNGNVLEKKDPRGGTTYFVYDGDNRLTSVTTPLGLKTSFDYDETGNVIAVFDPADGETNTPYDLDGRLEFSSTPLDLKTAFDYDEMGRLTKQINPDDTFIEYTYNKNGWALTFTDARGNTERYDYDNLGNLKWTKEREQYKTQDVYTKNDYDEDGRLTKFTDQKSGETDYFYDDNDNITEINDARGNSSYFTYDKNNLLSVVKDAEGWETKYGYDGLGNLTSTERPEGGIFENTYYKNDLLKDDTDALGHKASRVYDGNGNLISYTDRRGYTKEYEYDADDRLVKATDTLNKDTAEEEILVTEYVYNDLGLITEVINAQGNSSGSGYDDDGRKTMDYNELAKDGKPVHRVFYDYDKMGRVTKRTFEDGSFETFTYDENGNVLSKTDERNNTTNYVYDKNDRLIKVTDPMKGVTEYTYTPTGQLETILDAEKGLTVYEYDENDNVTKMIDPEENEFIYGYDKNNQLISVKDPREFTTGYVYDKNGNLKEIHNPDKGVEKYGYDKNDRMTSYTDGENYTTFYDYDENGNLTLVTDPRDNTFESVYDELNRRVLTINEEGGKVALKYDELGNIIEATNEDRVTTKYTYDAKSRLTKIEDTYGHFKIFKYDPRDRVKSITDENEVERLYTYDAKGNLIMWTDGEVEREKYSYDKNDNMLTLKDRNGGVTRYTYDLLNRVTSETDPLGNTKYFIYDKNSRIVGYKDKNGNETEYKLDGNGNIIEIIDAKDHSTLFGYDPMNRLNRVELRRIDGIHKVDEIQKTLYYFDKRGLVVREVNAKLDEKIFVYDGNGNLIHVTDEDLNITEYEYSPVNLAIEASYSGGKVANFLYNGTGELIWFKDWNGETSIERDRLNRILTVNDHMNKETHYRYDPVGNVKSIGYPDGGQVDNYYDRENRIVTLVDVVEGVYDFEYDPNGNLISKEYPNFETSLYYYDANNQPIEMDEFELGGKKALATLYKWDPNGNLLSEKSYNHGTSQQIVANTGAGSGTGNGNSHRSDFKLPPPMTLLEDGTVINPSGHPPPGLNGGAKPWKDENKNKPGTGALGEGSNAGLKESRVFEYDALNQMVRSNLDGTVTNYTYDTVGNLILEKIGNGNTAVDYQYNIMNQLVRRLTNSDTSTYEYDKRGNRIKETTKNKVQTYFYDGTNHLTRGMNVNKDVTEFTYNALFMRVNSTQIAHSGNVYSRDYVIDYTSGDENVDLVTYAHGEYYQQQVYLKANGHSERLMQLTDTSTANSGVAQQERKLNIHEDPLWTTKKFTKGDGTEFSYLKYDAWGLPAQPNKLMNNDRGNFIAANFTGHTYDTVLGFYHAEARFYDPVGRIWTARDPAKDGLNWYRYVENNPATKNDPTGKFVNIIVGAIIGAAVGFGSVVIPALIKGEEVDWKAAGISAAIGAGTGALAGATFGASLAATAAIGAGSKVAVIALPNVAKVGLTMGANIGGNMLEQKLINGKIDPLQTGVAAGLSALPFGVGKFLTKTGIGRAITSAVQKSGLVQAVSKFTQGGCKSIVAGVKRVIEGFKAKIFPNVKISPLNVQQQAAYNAARSRGLTASESYYLSTGKNPLNQAGSDFMAQREAQKILEEYQRAASKQYSNVVRNNQGASPQQIGTWTHKNVANEMTNYANNSIKDMPYIKEISIEQNFLKGTQIPNNAAISSRVDIVITNRVNSNIIVGDLKTGNAGYSTAQQAKNVLNIADPLSQTTNNFTHVEIRPW